MLVPALGGPERKTAEVSLPDRSWVSPPFLSWFPDSQSLAVVDMLSNGPAAIFRVSTSTGERRQLTFPPSGVQGDTAVAVSPDGRALAFGRTGQLGEWSWSIDVVPLAADGPPRDDVRPLTTRHEDRKLGVALGGIAWTADSRRIVYASGGSLWSLDVGTAGSRTSSAKLDVGEAPSHPAIARDTNRLVYAHNTGGDDDIWRAPLVKASGRAEPPIRLIASTRFDFAQQYSPDGRRIAFESDRGGNLEVWVCESDGSACSQLTRTGSAFTGTPRWSPDGERVAFYSRVDGSARIFVIGSHGGAQREIAAGGTSNMLPSWSRDGRWIYFGSNRTGRNEVWKVPAEGGEARQVTRHGGFAALESRDGRSLYFTRSEASDTGLFGMRLPDGEESQVLPSVVFHNFDVVSDGIYFASAEAQQLALRFHSFADARTHTIAALPGGYVGLSVSPDRKWVLYTADNPAESNLSLVENFR
jgi:Tol biopolymer transport system component